MREAFPGKKFPATLICAFLKRDVAYQSVAERSHPCCLLSMLYGSASRRGKNVSALPGVVGGAAPHVSI